ncbi:hypothetical protein ACOSP7_013442 [Xanthoceras sorbifolium]
MKLKDSEREIFSIELLKTSKGKEKNLALLPLYRTSLQTLVKKKYTFGKLIDSLSDLVTCVFVNIRFSLAINSSNDLAVANLACLLNKNSSSSGF